MKKSTESSQKRIRKLKIDIYLPIIKHILKVTGITARWSIKGELHDGQLCWWADIDNQEVVIPEPITTYKFMVCLHEIGHVIQGSRKLYHMQELVAEEWALNTAKRFGITMVTVYKKKAAQFLLRYVKDDINAGLVDRKKINKKVRRFITKNGQKYEV